MKANVTKIYKGNIIHCTSTEEFTIQSLNGFVAINDEKILAVDDLKSLEQYSTQFDFSNAEEILLEPAQILIPGLIDTHIHASQYPNVGLGMNKPLLDWLNNHTFQIEQQFKEKEFAKRVYNAVVKRTLCHGTTTACYFATLYSDTTLYLADAAIRYGQRAFIGKVNMTRLSPIDYLETSEETVTNTRNFVKAVLAKKSPLVKPIITPRFALSLEINDMRALAAIAKEFDLPIQSHVSENEEEVREVFKLFSKNYVDVYADAGILTDKTILAHGIHLTTSEIEMLKQTGTSISHCPLSNFNLKSGLCDVRKLMEAGVKVGLGTDLSGGHSPSIIEAMRGALNTSIALSLKETQSKSYETLGCYEALYLATLGGAKALGLSNIVGNFEIGKEFDAIIVDMDIKECNADLLIDCDPLELLQKFIYVGDDRNIVSVFVGGKQVKPTIESSVFINHNNGI